MISVVIPTYKRADLLARLLDSIILQTAAADEVIVVDDASPNPEEYTQVIYEYKSKINNLKYIRYEQNRGAPHARNIGIKEAKNDWIALVDDDDEWLPEKLEKQWAFVESAKSNAGLIYTWADTKGPDGEIIEGSRATIEGDARREILTTNFITSASVLLRKDAVMDAGMFDESLPSCQDWDMWAKILNKGYACKVVPEVLTIYHRHGQESIGLSSRARLGYKIFLEKHWRPIVQHTSILNIIKKAWLYFSVRKEAL